MQKQTFYAVAHNPNTVKEAEQFLKAGVNALGPDIKYENGMYYVSHGGPGSNPLTEEYSLGHYLTGLKEILTTNPGKYNLALIIFDVKNPVFDINDFLAFVHAHFLAFEYCGGVSIIISTADVINISFLNNYNQEFQNVGVAIDEYSKSEEVLYAFRAGKQKNIAYGNGITSFLPKPGLYHSICEAKYLQAQHEGFKLVFVWVLKTAKSIENYLYAGVDAVIIDMEEVSLLLGVLRKPGFATRYEMATYGQNPWLGDLPPIYTLTVKTSNQLFAGTDAPIRFKLSGTNGSLETIIFTGLDKMMEKDGINHLTLQGKNIGTLETLSIELLDTSMGCAWLPKSIEISGDSVIHIFNFTLDEWLNEKQPLIIKSIH